MKRVGTLLLVSLLVLLQATITTARAEAQLPASIVISEIQPNGSGSGTTLQEFIELTNSSNAQVDVSNYRVVYTNSSGKEFDLVTFGVDTLINPGGSLLLVPINPTNSFLPDISPKISYIAPSSSGMAPSSACTSVGCMSAAWKAIGPSGCCIRDHPCHPEASRGTCFSANTTVITAGPSLRSG